MNTMQTLKAAVLVALGLGCAVAAFTVSKANAVSGTANVAYSASTNAAGEAMPVVTVTAKKLSTTQKLVLAMRDAALTNGKHG
jgi:predicted alpha/beta hydrolase family esterase